MSKPKRPRESKSPSSVKNELGREGAKRLDEMADRLGSLVDDVLPERPRKSGKASGRTLADIVDDAERLAVEAALRAADGSRERAAEALDISPTTLWRKMTRLGISFEGR